jgi:cyclophilin family peptidyl-prolyl cis-trans isomerase
MKNTAPILWAVAIVGVFILGYLGYRGEMNPSANTPPATEEAPTIPAPSINPEVTQPDQTQNTMNDYTTYAKITTNKGVITVGLYGKDAPKTVENFVTLAQKKFYNGVIFHRVIPGFMIQGGDPKGTGTGGPGYQFADEINPTSALYERGYKRGVLAMANAGPNTNGSQFFIMHADYPLPPSYTIFGNVVSGLEVVDAIASVKTSQDRPLEPVTMTSVDIVNQP